MARKNLKLGEMLVGAGIIDEFQLNSALSLQRNLGGRLGQALIRLGYISEDRLLSFLSEQLNCPRVNLAEERIPADLRELVPEEKARQFNVVPIRRGAMSGTAYLLVAMSDPTNLMVIDALQFMTGCRIRPAIAPESEISQAIDRCYGRDGSEAPHPPLRQDGDGPVAGSKRQGVENGVLQRPRSTEMKLQALLQKLHELGVLTRQEYEELK
ncbi:type IV pilus assembly protein PilB [Geothermobacter ehrlichii]|uniref:Type IV pilus assembly protein PilB n=1 Tax=Geothermobacter ehrlichii TaxID=213224 RepID=A0A5D3WMM1_9BACT|nr:hypothetical protein [Geothermobacter ehrlichii]TYO99586.1 type IV pilus assembly protein PilB [Geothermobacter ehrlichii]